MRNTGCVNRDKADGKADEKGDDEALSWAGDVDPTHAGVPAEPATASATDSAGEVHTADKPAVSSALLVTLGILAGIYLLYTAGWVITTQRNVIVLPGLLDRVMFQAREFLAIMAPAVWFASVLVLTRGRKPLVRLLWLFVGAVVLVPVPFVLGV